ncbi:MAG: flagellar assembly protein FliH [Marinobacter sp.]|nr:flagellar assembly protein FliH [Marinobacter sp.]
MKGSQKDLHRIPKEKLTAYERWELPLLDEKGNEVPREEERNVKPLTASDLKEIREAAREDGFREGRETGYREGHAEGFEQGRAEGRETGLSEGREEGRSTGLEETRKEVDAKLDRLEHLLAELLLPIRRHEDEIETALVNLTTVLARAVVYRELSIDSSQIQQVVRRALDSLPSTADAVRIHIHPDDSELVEEVAGRLDTPASVVEDETVLPGGCRVETRHSLVDFTVEKRFQRAVQDMLDRQLGEGEAVDAEELDSLMGDLTDFHRDVLSGSAGEVEPDAPSAGEQGEGDNDVPPG